MVRIVPFEALRIAAGHPMICSTVDGEEVRVRLYATDELYDIHVRTAAKCGAPVLGRAEIADRCRPLDLGGDR